MAPRPSAGSDHSPASGAPNGWAVGAAAGDVGHGQGRHDQAQHGGVDQRRERLERDAGLRSQPEPEQARHELPGAGDPGQVVLLGLGERCLNLVAEPAVGQAQERGVQGQVGAPAG